MRGKVAPLIKKGDAARVVALLEMFTAGGYEKSEEIDDSSGGFGQFVEGQFCDWIRARQAAKADPDETAGMLLAWMENDDYGHCHGLEKEGDVDAYAALCEAETDLAPADCETLAELCLKRRRPEDALAWVERGLELERRDAVRIVSRGACRNSSARS